jgi:hypothetical protein
MMPAAAVPWRAAPQLRPRRRAGPPAERGCTACMRCHPSAGPLSRGTSHSAPWQCRSAARHTPGCSVCHGLRCDTVHLHHGLGTARAPPPRHQAHPHPALESRCQQQVVRASSTLCAGADADALWRRPVSCCYGIPLLQVHCRQSVSGVLVQCYRTTHLMKRTGMLSALRQTMLAGNLFACMPSLWQQLMLAGIGEACCSEPAGQVRSQCAPPSPVPVKHHLPIRTAAPAAGTELPLRWSLQPLARRLLPAPALFDAEWQVAEPPAVPAPAACLIAAASLSGCAAAARAGHTRPSHQTALRSAFTHLQVPHGLQLQVPHGLQVPRGLQPHPDDWMTKVHSQCCTSAMLQQSCTSHLFRQFTVTASLTRLVTGSHSTDATSWLRTAMLRTAL